MLLHLKAILTQDEVQAARARLGDDAPWVDGRSSAGGQAVGQKQNHQLAQDSDTAQQLQQLVLSALQRDPLFFSATLPKKIFNPLFNRYTGNANRYGAHIDGAVLRSQQPQQWVRSDISCTLFLSEPESYEGGELVIQDHHGSQRIKLAAGDMVVYPGTSVHGVEPVTQGQRLASFFWIESMVRGNEQRRLLFDLDMNLLKLRTQHGETAETTALTGCYHNLLRMWADT
jgi:PKHD-type hydroxylase